MYGSRCVSFLHGKPLRSILLECGYFGFLIPFWISPKKRKIRFWILQSVSGFPPPPPPPKKKAPEVRIYGESPEYLCYCQGLRSYYIEAFFPMANWFKLNINYIINIMLRSTKYRVNTHLERNLCLKCGL